MFSVDGLIFASVGSTDGLLLNMGNFSYCLLQWLTGRFLADVVGFFSCFLLEVVSSLLFVWFLYLDFIKGVLLCLVCLLYFLF